MTDVFKIPKSVPEELIMPALAAATACVNYCADPMVYRKWVIWQADHLTLPPGSPSPKPPSPKGLDIIANIIAALAIENLTEDQVDYMRFLEALEGWDSGG